MDRPAQVKFDSAGNMRTVLVQPKPIRRLRVLQIRPQSVSSWHSDVMQLARLWERMLRARAISPRLLPLFSKWASYLLQYGRAFGIHPDMGFVVKNIRSVHQNGVWLANYVAEVSRLNGMTDIYGDDYKDFQVETWWKNDGSDGNRVQQCNVLHKQSKKLAVYRTSFAERNPLLSIPVGMESLAYIHEKVKTGLAEHRSVKKRQVLVQEIEKHVGRHQKQRLRTDRIFG